MLYMEENIRRVCPDEALGYVEKYKIPEMEDVHILLQTKKVIRGSRCL